MLLLSNDEIRQLLTMDECIGALETGYKDLLKGDAVFRPRIDVYAPSERPDGYYRWGTMEGVCRSIGVFAIRMKSDIVYWTKEGTEEKYCFQPGTYCGLVFLFSIANGEPLAILQDGYLQHMRVGGCAGLGARYLSRPDSELVGILGSGGMARTHLEAFSKVRNLAKAKVYSPTRTHRESYAREMSRRLGIKVVAVETPEEAVKDSDIVATCTNSTRHVLTNVSWIEPGMHLSNVRGHELAPEVIGRANILVKLGQGSTAPVSYRCGRPEELARLPEVREPYPQDCPSLADMMAGRFLGRTSRDQVSLFINSGTQGLQFASVGGRVYRLARDKGIGREIPSEWFLQKTRD